MKPHDPNGTVGERLHDDRLVRHTPGTNGATAAIAVQLLRRATY